MLEEDIRKLRQKHNLGGVPGQSLLDYRKTDGAAGVGGGSSGHGGSKFTGFRHANRSETVNAAGSNCGKGPDAGSPRMSYMLPSSCSLGGIIPGPAVPGVPHSLLPGLYSFPTLGPNLPAQAFGSLTMGSFQSTDEYYASLHQMGLFGGLAGICGNGHDGPGHSVTTSDSCSSGRTSHGSSAEYYGFTDDCDTGTRSVSTTSSEHGGI
jgi:hypothetical protein